MAIDDPFALLWLTYAYSCNDLEAESLEQARANGLLRRFTEADTEQQEFQCARDCVIAELAKPPFDVDPRYIWSRDAYLQFPTADPWPSLELKLYVGVGGWMPGVQILLFSLAYCLKRSPSEERLIALIQSYLRDDGSLDGLTVQCGGRRYASCHAFLTSCAQRIAVPHDDPQPFWISELRTGEAREVLAGPDTKVAQRTYGLLTGDEGWHYVPAARAKKLAKAHWSSRDFLWVGAFGPSVVIYNDKSAQYSTDATKFFQKWFAVEKPYYSTNFHVAGLDHGVLYAVEGAILLKLTAGVLIQEIKDVVRISGHGRRQFATLRMGWSELLRGHLGSMRLRVFRYLDDVRHIGVGELSSLDQLIAEQSGLTKAISDVERYGEMIDDQLINLATVRLNAIVILLTVVTIIVGALALIHL